MHTPVWLKLVRKLVRIKVACTICYWWTGGRNAERRARVSDGDEWGRGVRQAEAGPGASHVDEHEGNSSPKRSIEGTTLTRSPNYLQRQHFRPYEWSKLLSVLLQQHGNPREMVVEPRAAAAVGQSGLMSLYEAMFSQYGVKIAQVIKWT